MKKFFAITACAVMSATMLCSCGKPSNNIAAARSRAIGGADLIGEQTDIMPDTDVPTVPDYDTDGNTEPRDEQAEISITITGKDLDRLFGCKDRKPIPGVRRRFWDKHDRSGTYIVEYIHTPHGIDKDETLDYKLDIKNDHTFEMSVVSDGVKAEHYGHWYARRDCITLFYDEETDPTAHNVYVADSLYGEMFDNRIIIYDNCHTIVLARSEDDIDPDMQVPSRKTQSTDSDTNNNGINDNEYLPSPHHKKLA